LSRCCPTLSGSWTTLCMRIYRSIDAEAKWLGEAASEMAVPDRPEYRKSVTKVKRRIQKNKPLYPYEIFPLRKSTAYTFEP
jgi:hypothetical protein